MDKIAESVRRWSFLIPVFGTRKVAETGVEEEIVESTSEEDIVVVTNDAEDDEEGDIDDDFASAASAVQETSTNDNSVNYGKFPAHEFFLRWRETELVVDYDPKTNKVVLNKLNLASYKYQLWTYDDGHIINFSNKFVLDTEKDTLDTGLTLYLKPKSDSKTQLWAITPDGSIFSADDSNFHFGAKDGDNLHLHSKEEFLA
jgi:hypothetical protein